MSKRAAILQSNYIPWKGYFDLIDSVDDFVIYDIVQYTKNDWRNRNKVKTSNGTPWLTIPVAVSGIEQRICDTKVANSKWAKKHHSTLAQSYAKAPYYKHFKDELIQLYESAASLELLSDINILFIKWVCEKLSIKTNIIDCAELELHSEDKVLRLVEICQSLNASTYVSGPAAKDYIPENVFDEAQIKLEWMDYSGYPEYQQLHQGYESAISVFDAILNLGPDAPQFVLRRHFESM